MAGDGVDGEGFKNFPNEYKRHACLRLRTCIGKQTEKISKSEQVQDSRGNFLIGTNYRIHQESNVR